MKNPNFDLLLNIAHRLRPLLDEVVFVGGCTTALLITDPGAEAIRPTYDVDVIVEITSYADYAVFSERLRALGFQEDSSEGAPLCRWQWEQTKLDAMPLDEGVLGFSNRWYRETMTKAELVRLDPKTVIRAITAPYFLATKLEAFHGRGGGDVFASHDLEDVIAVLMEDQQSLKRSRPRMPASAHSSQKPSQAFSQIDDSWTRYQDIYCRIQPTNAGSDNSNLRWKHSHTPNNERSEITRPH
jgi:hypothetical protein